LAALESNATRVEFDRSQPEYLGTFTPDIEPDKGDPDRNLRNAHEGCRAVLLAWREREKLIDSNPHLTEAGRIDAKAKALPEFEEKLKPLEQVITSHAGEITELERTVSNLNMAQPSPQAEIRAGELRSWFAAQPKGGAVGQVAILREALETNNLELLHAICSANPALKLVDPKVRSAILSALGERQHPREVALLDLKRKRVEVAQFGLGRVRELLRGSTPAAMRERFVRA
jgi:hypothetical protein